MRSDFPLYTTSTVLCTRFSLSMEISRLTRDGTAEPVSRDQILRHARGQGNVHFPCSADHEQDWQPYPVDPYSAICDDHTYIHTYIQWGLRFKKAESKRIAGLREVKIAWHTPLLNRTTFLLNRTYTHPPSPPS